MALVALLSPKNKDGKQHDPGFFLFIAGNLRRCGYEQRKNGA
jgi:hypothetical protein